VVALTSLMPKGDSIPEPTFEAVVVPDSRRLYTLALSILRDQGEAEDAVQETLVKAWRSWESVSRMERRSQWLTRVCVNHCISRRRHLRSRGWPPLDLFESPGSGIGGGPSADVIDMDRAYRQLSLKQRAAITLNYRHGYSVEECAAFMGCRPGTVRTHVARGLATLRKELGDA
jgi:DNA-directed RNA polymerase specialized sigma24 family protein